MTPKEKFEQEQNFLETSPDEILDIIKIKIDIDRLDGKWLVEGIKKILERNQVNDAVGKIGEVFDLDKKELEHLKKLPAEVILKLFRKEDKE